jgi:hypothetical protein
MRDFVLELRGQIADLQPAFRIHGGKAFDAMLQLANIPRPLVMEQQVQNFLAGLKAARILHVDRIQEVLNQ